ncbi:hypothetical protein [Aureivirga marina]|uniref:hypothetical protein n=1 Tax=Aureivirga marina TaxID=1182451 RepID=UPI0018CB6DC0|nr:hypothetical protein [Aureivirga marina]
MKIEIFKKIFKTESHKKKYDAISSLKKEEFTKEVFEILCNELNAVNNQDKFLGLFYLINNYSEELKNADEKLVDTIYNLLFIKDGTIISRAIWALSLIGDKALDRLIFEYEKEELEQKIIIIHAIGRGNFSERSKDRVEVLLKSLRSDEDELKFTGMCELMSNSNPNETNVWYLMNDSTIDIKKIHEEISIIAKEFIRINNKESYIDFSLKYIDEIKNLYSNQIQRI